MKGFPFTHLWDVSGCARSFFQSPQSSATPLRLLFCTRIPTLYPQARSRGLLWVCKNKLIFYFIYFIFLFFESEVSFFFFKYLFIYLFLAVLGLRFCARAFSSCGERGPLFIVVRGPLLLRSTSSRRAGSVVVAHGPSCSAARGIFPDQGSNPCPLHWQADSQPLPHQGSPISWYFKKAFLKSLIFLMILSFDENITFQSIPFLSKFPVIFCDSLRYFYSLLPSRVGQLPGKVINVPIYVGG